MKFLRLTYLDRGLSPGPKVATEYDAVVQLMRSAEVIIDSGQLAPSTASKTVRITDSLANIVDGPPVIDASRPSAYFLIECEDLDDALRWAARIPAARYGSIEVRPPR